MSQHVYGFIYHSQETSKMRGFRDNPRVAVVLKKFGTGSDSTFAHGTIVPFE
jgi:hypothetical protein